MSPVQFHDFSYGIFMAFADLRKYLKEDSKTTLVYHIKVYGNSDVPKQTECFRYFSMVVPTEI